MQSGCLLYGRVFLDVLAQKSLSSGANTDGVFIAYTLIGNLLLVHCTVVHASVRS